MVIATQPVKLSFVDYLSYTPADEGRYELVEGTLVTMPPPTWLHLLIAKFLVNALDTEIAKLGRQQEWTMLYEPGQRTDESDSRLPDVVVVPFAAMEDVFSLGEFQEKIYQFPDRVGGMSLQRVTGRAPLQDWSDVIWYFIGWKSP